jgi:hypothetical protein
MTRLPRFRKQSFRGPMRSAVSTPSLVASLALAGAFSLTGCDGCRSSGPSAQERNQALASAIAAPAPAPSARSGGSIGHAANVIPGQGPKRVEHPAPRTGALLPILPGQGLGPIRFGATRQTIERLMGAPCDEASETRCRYVGRAVDFKLDKGVVTEMRVSRKGREAKRSEDGSIIEYGFFNGVLLPDLYFGMQPSALQEVLGPPQKIEKVSPMGPDGFSERHFYDGVMLEYDLWSNGKLVLGAAVLTKSETAIAANEKIMAEMAKRTAEAGENAKRTPPTRAPR